MDTRQKDTKTQEEEDDAVAWADHRRRQSRPSAAAVMQLLLEGFMNCQRSRDELMEKEPAARGWVEHVRGLGGARQGLKIHLVPRSGAGWSTSGSEDPPRPPVRGWGEHVRV
ncbi:unnamed protein product [Gadus morhua 'NCC']